MSDVTVTGKRMTLSELKASFDVHVKKEVLPEKQKEQVVTPSKKDETKISTQKSKTDSGSISFVDHPDNVEKPKAKTTSRPRDINTRSVFHNTDLATAEDVDKILKSYHSPHAGKGQVIVDMCKKYNVNPILMLAIMQQESQFGSKSLKIENQANPFSVHFNQKAKGIKKLRLKDGNLPTFEQSLEGALKTMVKLSGNSATPLSTAGSKYCETSTWTNNVTSHYHNLLRKF